MSRQLNKATVESERQPTLSLTKSTRKSVVDSFFQSSQQRPDYKFGSAFISKSTSSFGNEAEKDCYKKPSQKASKNEEAAEVARVLSNEEEKEMTCHLENSTYLSISKGLVNGLNKPKSQMSENVKDSKSMSIVEEACRKQLLQNHLSVIEAMELLELNADQEIVKQAMDQLFQLDIVRPPSEIEVWAWKMNDTIRQSIVALAEKSPYVSYRDLHSALGTANDRALENLLIEAIHEQTIEGKLDPSKQIVEISDWRASVPDATQCEFIMKTLGEWVEHCETLIGDLNTAATSSNERAKQTKEEDEQHEKEVDENAQAYSKTYVADMDGNRMYNYPNMRDKSRRSRGHHMAGPSRRQR